MSPPSWVVNAIVGYLHKHPGSDVTDIHNALHVSKDAAWLGVQWLYDTGLIVRCGIAGYELATDANKRLFR